MSNFPKTVFIREEGPREGFQILKEVFPTEDKARLIEALAQTGITSIETTSFVRPDRIPQHADAEELAKLLLTKNIPSTVRLRALYLNEKGFLRALQCPAFKTEGYVHIAGSSKFLEKNSNITLEQALTKIPTWIELFQANNIRFERLMVSTAFGDQYAGTVSLKQIKEIIGKAHKIAKESGEVFEEITLADTTGWAQPEQVRSFVAELKSDYPDIHICLHLHDTRGLGMPNVYAGLLEGVDRFDASLAGLGGCPFSGNAAGNVPTEDVAFLCENLGIKTGLNLNKYIECAKLAESIIKQKLPGKLKDAGLNTVHNS